MLCQSALISTRRTKAGLIALHSYGGDADAVHLGSQRPGCGEQDHVRSMYIVAWYDAHVLLCLEYTQIAEIVPDVTYIDLDTLIL